MLLIPARRATPTLSATFVNLSTSQVNDAEKYKEEDEKQKERISAKNSLESYAFNIKQSVEDEKLKDKISDDDKKAIMDKCSEVIAWLDNNQVICPLV